MVAHGRRRLGHLAPEQRQARHAAVEVIKVALDLPFNPSTFDQARDRVYRLGQRREVTVHTFVVDNSVEQWQERILARKRRLAAAVIGEAGAGDAPS
ncbi:MAG: hypothetical protein VXW31_04675, partial [Planctomycetota bacterium]|nr:hypothetical protein [Planctomycetota bacterium]